MEQMNFAELMQAVEMNADLVGATGSIDPTAGLFLAGFAGLGILGLILAVIMMVSWCFLFKKMGKKWYEGLVSGHNFYVLLEKAGKPGRWIFAPFVMILPIPIVAQVVGVVLTILVWISMSLGVSKKFGKGNGFGIGLILLPFIFYPILAWGNATYSAK